MKTTNLVLLGPPGAGKGTQAEKLTAEFAIPHISTGDIFRAAIKDQTPLGKKAQKYLDGGELVPDEIVIGIVAERLRQQDTEGGFLLDGFPRTVPQADALTDFLTAEGRRLTAVINIAVPPEVLVKRLSGRRICRQCGAVYHVERKKEKQAGVCDQCGGPLYQREDDREEIVRNRLEVYFRQTEPLIRYYQEAGLLLEVNGDQDIAGVYQEIITALRGTG
ncbi:MAG: adenylate kinase [Firmicutes bacterium]|nr:adenylate kinase [Bacillota bacterium]